MVVGRQGSGRAAGGEQPALAYQGYDHRLGAGKEEQRQTRYIWIVVCFVWSYLKKRVDRDTQIQDQINSAQING